MGPPEALVDQIGVRLRGADEGVGAAINGFTQETHSTAIEIPGEVLGDGRGQPGDPAGQHPEQRGGSVLGVDQVDLSLAKRSAEPEDDSTECPARPGQIDWAEAGKNSPLWRGTQLDQLDAGFGECRPQRADLPGVMLIGPIQDDDHMVEPIAVDGPTEGEQTV